MTGPVHRQGLGTRGRILAATALVAVAMAGHPVVALADGGPSPTPAAVPGGGSTTATGGTGTGTSTGTSTAGSSSTASSSGTSSAAPSSTAPPVTQTPKPTPTTPPPVVRTVSFGSVHPFVARHHYSLSGRVAPRTPGRASVSVQRWTHRHWSVVANDRVDGRGRYAVRFGSTRPGRYLFRSVATWTNGEKATSRRLIRTVVALPEVHVSGPLTRRAVPYSYRPGCPVGPAGLRRITINRFTYHHRVARGSLVVRTSAVPDLLRVFRASFASRFPVHSMRPSDRFYAGGRRTPTGSDVAAMKADNTSAFNCRPVTGNPYRVSQHSYGNAIDINTVRNPYVVGSRVYPSWARTYLDRSNVRTGMIRRSGVIAGRMRHNGWPWGARWAHPDYQHFSSNGG